MPCSEKGKISFIAEGPKNPNLIVRAFDLIRQGKKEVFCSVVSVCTLQGMAGCEMRACLTCNQQERANI